MKSDQFYAAPMTLTINVLLLLLRCTAQLCHTSEGKGMLTRRSIPTHEPCGSDVQTKREVDPGENVNAFCLLQVR